MKDKLTQIKLLKEYCNIRDGIKIPESNDLLKWKLELEKNHTWCCKNIIECIIELINGYEI